MKFGKQLEKVMDISDPEWGACAREFARKPVRALSARARAPGTHAAPFFIRYSVLKHMIKDIVSETTPDAGEPSAAAPKTEPACESTSVTATAASVAKAGRSSESDTSTMMSSEGEVAFFRFLRVELKKASEFYENTVKQMDLRRKRMSEGVLQLKSGPTVKQSNDERTHSFLVAACIKFYKELVLLENFAIMTYCGFSKILKKHDKLTGHCTREQFMRRCVNGQPFAQHTRAIELIREVEVLYQELGVSEVDGSAGLSDGNSGGAAAAAELSRKLAAKSAGAGPDGLRRVACTRGVMGLEDLSPLPFARLGGGSDVAGGAAAARGAASARGGMGSSVGEAGEAAHRSPARLNSNDDMIIIDAIIHLRNQNARVMQEESDVLRADSAASYGALPSSDGGDSNERLGTSNAPLGPGGVGALLPRGSRASADGSGAAALRNPNVSLAPEPSGDKNSMRKEGRTTAVKTKREAEGTALAPACPRSSLTKRTRPATARAGVPASTGRRPKRRAAS